MEHSAPYNSCIYISLVYIVGRRIKYVTISWSTRTLVITWKVVLGGHEGSADTQPTDAPVPQVGGMEHHTGHAGGMEHTTHPCWGYGTHHTTHAGGKDTTAAKIWCPPEHRTARNTITFVIRCIYLVQLCHPVTEVKYSKAASGQYELFTNRNTI